MEPTCPLSEDTLLASEDTFAPHVVTVAEVDLHATSKLREEHKEKFKKAGVPLTFLSFVCAATVKALREHPQVNARVLDNSFVILRDINLGVAVDTAAGLIVPSIKHADQLSLRGVAANIDELASRARTGKITADDPGFARLLVWSDVNSDRVSTANELSAAGARELVAIELGYTVERRCDTRGNCELERASFRYRDGRGQELTGAVVDVHLRLR